MSNKNNGNAYDQTTNQTRVIYSDRFVPSRVSDCVSSFEEEEFRCTGNDLTSTGFVASAADYNGDTSTRLEMFMQYQRQNNVVDGVMMVNHHAHMREQMMFNAHAQNVLPGGANQGVGGGTNDNDNNNNNNNNNDNNADNNNNNNNGSSVRTVVANTEREDTSAAYHQLLRSELALPVTKEDQFLFDTNTSNNISYEMSPSKLKTNKKTLRFKTDSPPSSHTKHNRMHNNNDDDTYTGNVEFNFNDGTGSNNNHNSAGGGGGIVREFNANNTAADDNNNGTTFSQSPYSLSPIGKTGPLGTTLHAPRRTPRKIARSPFKVLDAPALQDDFYLNLVDWSSHNVLAVGLGTCVYLWSACTSRVTKLCDLAPNDTVCSVAWTQRGTYLAVGTNTGEVQIWDAAKCKRIRTMAGHRSRVGTLAWSTHILSSGSRDRSILQRDIRASEDFTGRLAGHKSEVCGLKWSYDDRELASGGNDNQLLIWSAASTSGGPSLRLPQHQAAVKAISWSPHQHGLLASGGGTADRCIRFWNTTTNTPLQCIDTGSQVCNLVWSKNVNEIVSTHGYSQNQIVVWRYPTMSKLATLTGHTMRVLYLAISPDGQTIVTGAGDETLRFWNVFPRPRTQGAVQENSVWNLNRTQIR